MEEEKEYDAFISYKRQSGFYFARLLSEEMEKREIVTFMDLKEGLKELHSGKFNEKLYEIIEKSKNFILILTKDALDGCVEEKDWVRKETLKAFKAGCNIIPILMEDFEWPREKYEQLPEEIASLEDFSGVNTSQDYFDAMIDKLISFLDGVKKRKSVEVNMSSNKYFENRIQQNGNIKSVDMEFHAGSAWFNDSEKVDMLYKMVEQGIQIRVLLNDPITSEKITKHMRDNRKSYMSFEKAIKYWFNLKEKYSEQVKIKIVNIPILRRYYAIHMDDEKMDNMNVKYYTFGNAIQNKNYQSVFYCDSPYFNLYRNEFEYLWNIGKECNNLTEALACIDEKCDTFTFFKEALNKINKVEKIDMFFRAGSEWHTNTDMVELLSEIINRQIKIRVIVNEQKAVAETAKHMKQHLKKYLGYDNSLEYWHELEKRYPDNISVHIADIPLMRRYHTFRGTNDGITRISNYTYGNYNPKKDQQSIFKIEQEYYDLYMEEFEYLWNNASHIIE